MLKIITLGTSHGDPTPQRFNVSTLLETEDGTGYLIDAGTPALGSLIRQGFDMQKLRAVFITHSHEDHIGGVPDLLKFQGKRLPPGNYTTYYFPEVALIDGMRAFIALSHRSVNENANHLCSYQSGVFYADDHLAIEAIPTDHFSNEGHSFPSYALKITCGSQKLLFTGDLSKDFHDFPAGHQVDLAFCELTHYRLETAMPILAQQAFRMLVFTHIGNEWHGTEAEKYFALITSILPYPAVIAKDNDIFTI